MTEQTPELSKDVTVVHKVAEIVASGGYSLITPPELQVEALPTVVPSRGRRIARAIFTTMAEGGYNLIGPKNKDQDSE